MAVSYLLVDIVTSVQMNINKSVVEYSVFEFFDQIACQSDTKDVLEPHLDRLYSRQEPIRACHFPCKSDKCYVKSFTF